MFDNLTPDDFKANESDPTDQIMKVAKESLSVNVAARSFLLWQEVRTRVHFVTRVTTFFLFVIFACVGFMLKDFNTVWFSVVWFLWYLGLGFAAPGILKNDK